MAVNAIAKKADGSYLLVVGITEENVTELRKGHPFRLEIPERLALRPYDVVSSLVICYGASTEALVEMIKPLIGPDTTTITWPREQALRGGTRQ